MNGYPSIEEIIKRELGLEDTPRDVAISTWELIRKGYPQRKKGMQTGSWKQSWVMYVKLVYGKYPVDPRLILAATRDYARVCAGTVEFTPFVMTIDRFFREMPARVSNQESVPDLEGQQLTDEEVESLFEGL